MSDPLYRKEIMRLAADAKGAGKLENADACGVAHNPACGDKVEVQLAYDTDGCIAAFAHETKACVLTQASASILGAHLKGTSEDDVKHLLTNLKAMLRDGAPPPDAPFDVYSELAGAVSFAARHRCVLLPIEAVLTAMTSETPKPGSV